MFPLTVEGLDGLAAWLRLRGVTRAALLQGASAWPWQGARRCGRQVSGPIGLAYWLEYEGPDALSRTTDDAAWQPVMLALRDHIALFLVRPTSVGGPYAVEINRNTAQTLATSLASGDFLAEYPKPALERLIDVLAGGTPAAIEQSLRFFTAESRGYWHNRARAKMARRLKHCTLSDTHRRLIVGAIEQRLIDGQFTEQFRDQLRLLLHLDATAARRAAAAARASGISHVRRYGQWLADRLEQPGCQ